MRLKKTFSQILSEVLQPMVAYGLAIYGIALIYVYHIKRLVPAFAWEEKLATFSSRSLINIFNNPLNAPHKVLQYIMAKLAHQGYFAMRGVSIIIALFVIVCFYYVVRKWFSFRVAVLSTFLFATSSWMLHTVRLATPDIMPLSLIGAVAYGTWLKFNYRRPRLTILLGSSLILWLLYTPGMIWFVILGAIWQRKAFKNILTQNKTLSIIAFVSLTALVIPLAYSMLRDHFIIQTYLGFSHNSLSGFMEGAKSFLLIPVRLIVYGINDPVRNLGRMPYLDIIAVSLSIIGFVNFYQNDKKLDRFKTITGGLIIGCLLSAFGGVVGLQILLPFIYLFVAGGIAMVIEQWFRVFPTNPFAKILISVLLILALSATTFYNFSNYYIAWPQAPATQAEFKNLP